MLRNPAPEQYLPPGCELNVKHPSAQGLRSCWTFDNAKLGPRDLVANIHSPGFALAGIPSNCDAQATPLGTAYDVGNRIVFPRLSGCGQWTMQWVCWFPAYTYWFMSFLQSLPGQPNLLFGSSANGNYVTQRMDNWLQFEIDAETKNILKMGNYSFSGPPDEPTEPLVLHYVFDINDTIKLKTYSNGEHIPLLYYAEIDTATAFQTPNTTGMRMGVPASYTASYSTWNRALGDDELRHLGTKPHEFVNWPIGYRGDEELEGHPYHQFRRDREQLGKGGIV